GHPAEVTRTTPPLNLAEEHVG
ncbi:MAG: hypothetical protein JWR18_3791, partial [Segetibacter sp.]|nr:hypothetical protein [Segetibacter sp.]